ncbi:MAG: hypothetical protein GC181_00160 [Bacteroidetes bacterium]|nr:hypothetical protein [Bacteroidota bacterium]
MSKTIDRRLIFTTVLMSCFFSIGFAQNSSLISGQLGIGAGLKARGYGLKLDKGLHRFNNTELFSQLDVYSLKHPREVKIINQGAQNPSQYVFGKLYHTGIIRMSVGISRLIFPRQQTRGVGLAIRCAAGPVFAIKRPVYLDVMSFGSTDQTPNIETIKYSEHTNVNQSEIVGYSRHQSGWNDLEYASGVQNTMSVDIHWGSYDNTLKHVELGLMTEFFPSGLRIMAFGENPKIYSAPFITFCWSFNP